MKKIIVIVGILLDLIVIGVVAGGVYYINSPYKVAYDFKKEIEEANYEGALEYIIPEKRIYLEMALSAGEKIFGLISIIYPEIPSEFMEQAANIKWKKIDSGKKSSTKYYITLEGEYEENQTLSFDLILEKEDGEWYISEIENFN